MKLETEEQIPFYEGRITAGLEKSEKNPALQNMLKTIKKGGLEEFENDHELKNFAKGLEESFIKEGLLSKDGSLLPEGNAVVGSGLEMKRLQALFDVSFVENNGNLYLTECEVSKENGKDKQKEKYSVEELPGTFNDTAYAADNLTVRNIQLLQQGFLKKSQLSVSACSSYDFGNMKCRTTIKIRGKKNITITTGDKNYFTLLNTDSAVKKLKSYFEAPFEVRPDNTIWLTGKEHVEKNYSVFDKYRFERFVPQKKNTAEYDSVITQVCDTGSFCFESLKDARLCLDDDAAQKVLNDYLLKMASEFYLGKEEVGHLVMAFPRFFEECPSVTLSTGQIYEDLKVAAQSKQNKKAQLHLQSYQDLCPDELLKDYIVREPANFDGRCMCWNDFVLEIFGGNRNIKSVTTMSKYAYENQGLSRGFRCIADCLEETYGVTLNLISTEKQKNPGKKVENDFWDSLKNTVNLKIRNFDKDLRHIHDRYWKITRTEGTVEWFKTSGEVDALRYENDFSGSNPRQDITPETKGTMKELTVTYVEEASVLPDIQKLFSECEGN